MSRADVAGDRQGERGLVVPGVDELHRIGGGLLPREHPPRRPGEGRRNEPAAPGHTRPPNPHEAPPDRSSPSIRVQNRGFSPARSRASTSTRRRSSQMARPNIPSSRLTPSGPKRSYRGTIVSMSPVERNG